MNTLELINKTREYLDYLENHIHNVYKAWDILQEKCKDMRFIYDDYVFHSIDSEVQVHDLSKLSEDEFIQYRKVFFPMEGEPLYRLHEAWDHHKYYNSHHWENWTVLNSKNPYKWEIDCVHMVIDWMAMGYHFNDTAQSYYEKNKHKIVLPEYAVQFIYEIFERIKI